MQTGNKHDVYRAAVSTWEYILIKPACVTSVDNITDVIILSPWEYIIPGGTHQRISEGMTPGRDHRPTPSRKLFIRSVDPPVLQPASCVVVVALVEEESKSIDFFKEPYASLSRNTLHLTFVFEPATSGMYLLSPGKAWGISVLGIQQSWGLSVFHQRWKGCHCGVVPSNIATGILLIPTGTTGYTRNSSRDQLC